MRIKVDDIKMAGWLAKDGASVQAEIFLTEKELFALLAGYDVNFGGGYMPIGENIAVTLTLKKEEIK